MFTAAHLHRATYHKLYQIAFGILGAETDFGNSPKYWFRERFPWLVSTMKDFKGQKKKLHARYGRAPI